MYMKQIFKNIVLVLLPATLFLVACDETPKKESDTEGWEIVCVEGYQYIFRESGHRGYMASKFNQDGKPMKCDLSEGWKTE